MSDETITQEQGQQIAERAKDFLPTGDKPKYRYEGGGTGETDEEIEAEKAVAKKGANKTSIFSTALSLVKRASKDTVGSPAGIDCTHLVHEAVKKVVKDIPYITTETMNSTGWEKYYENIKETRDVRAGDVIVFKRNATDRFAHAGIVISIDRAQNKGRFIHSDTYDNTKEFSKAKKEKKQPPRKKYFSGPKEMGFIADLSVKSGFPSLKPEKGQSYENDFYGGYGRWVSKFLRPKKVVKEAEKNKGKKSSSAKTPQVATKGDGLCICIFPDVCLTPVGNTVVPVPYQIVAKFENSENVFDAVTFNGKPAFVHDQSTISKTIGAAAGSRKGIVSGTVSEKAVPKEGSSLLTINGKSIVCHGDSFEMNNGNTIGRANLFNCSPGCGVDANGKPTADTNPPRQMKKNDEPADQNRSQDVQAKGPSPTGNHGASNAGQGAVPPKRDPFEPLIKQNNGSPEKQSLADMHEI